MHKYPALRIAALLALGIFWGELLAPNPLGMGLCAALALGASLGFHFAKRDSLAASVLLQFSLIVIAAGVHSARIGTEGNRRLYPLYKGEEITVFGRVDSSPTLHDSVIRFTVRTDSLIRGGSTLRAKRRVTVRFESSQASTLRPLFYEERPIQLRAEIDIFPHRRNPGEIDFGKILALDNISGVLRLRNIADVNFPVELGAQSSIVVAARRRIGGAIDALYAGESSALLRGLLLGDRAFIEKDIIEDFSLSGTIHILAVSGAHVGVIASLLFGALLFIRLPRRWVSVLVIVGLWAFAFLTGSQPPVIRAVIMASVILVGVLLQRKPYPLNSLGVAGVVLLLFDTRSLFDPAVHLSFASVASLLLVFPRVRNLLTLTAGPSMLRRMINPVLALLSISFAALLGVSPFTAYYYGTVSIVALAANLFVVPLAGFVMSFGVASVIFKLVLPIAAASLAALTSELIQLMIVVARIASELPGASLQIPQPAPEMILFFYLFVGFLLLGNIKKTLIGIAGLTAIAVLGIGISNLIGGSDEPRLTLLDVGRGNSSVVAGGHEYYLINGGSALYTYDAGIAAIIPYLREIDCDWLSAVVVTSDRFDHIGGIPSVLRQIPVGQLFIPLSVPKKSSEWNLFEEAFVVNLPVSLLRPGEPIMTGSEFRLYPLAAERIDGKTEFGLLVRRGDSGVLIATGLSGESALQIARRYNGMFPVDILVLDARNSRSPTFVPLIKSASPRRVVITGDAPKYQPLFDPYNYWRVERDGAFEFGL